MIALLSIAFSLGAAPLFEVTPIALPVQDAHIMMVQNERGSAADIAVLGGGAFILYPEDGADPFTLDLPENASAIDVADLDGDGWSELIVIAGERILHYPLEDRGGAEPEPVFDLDTQFAGYEGPPFAQVLVLARDEERVLALPRENTLELRRPDGSLVATYPETEGESIIENRDSFEVSPLATGGLAPRDAIAWRIHRRAAPTPSAAVEWLPSQPVLPEFRRGTSAQARAAADAPPEAWPWFPLQPGGDRNLRVLHALEGNGTGETLVRIQQPAPQRSEAFDISGARRYPGRLVLLSAQQPDFNGDGYADLLLWDMPQPAPTVNGITQAVVGGDWPVRITARLYQPEEERFAPRPFAHLERAIPLPWLLDPEGPSPIRHLSAADFNGDGRSDLGFSPEEDSFAVWISAEEGFTDEPDFRHGFVEPIQDIVLTADLAGAGAQSIVLRGKNHAYLLTARQP